MKMSIEKLKQIKLKQVIYPAVLVIFLITLGTIFLKSISFISKTIDASLTVDDKSIEQGKLKIDLATYYQVAKKLHIPTPAPLPSGETPVVSPGATASPILSPTPSASPITKSALQIAVFNSTTTGGSAAQLKAKLTQAGFTVVKTGNQTPAETVTLIKTGTKVTDETFSEIKTLLSEKYPNAIRQTLATSSTYDIEIVIGNN